MTKRDDFSARVKRVLAERAGYHCCNPKCRSLTTGPEQDADGSVSLGEAAHITAAAPGGPRYDPNLTSGQRSGQENGIWLCVKCATLIDKGEKKLSIDTIREWKRSGEQAAQVGLESPHEFASGISNAFTIATVFRLTRPGEYFSLMEKPLPAGKQYRQRITIRPMGGDRERAENMKFMPMLLGSNFGSSPNAAVFMLTLENVGTGIEPQASIHLVMKGSPIWKQMLLSESRMSPTYTLKKNHTTGRVGFSAMNIMPGETLVSIVFANRKGPFNAECYYASASKEGTPMIFDVLVGEPEMAPALPPNPEAEKKQFPFE